MKARKIQSRAARAPMFSRSSIGSAVAMALIAASGAQAAETSVGVGRVQRHGHRHAEREPGNTNAAQRDGHRAQRHRGHHLQRHAGRAQPRGRSHRRQPDRRHGHGQQLCQRTIQLLTPLPVDNAATLGVSSTPASSTATWSTARCCRSRTPAERQRGERGQHHLGDRPRSTAALGGVGHGRAAAATQAGTAVLTYPAGMQLFDAKGNVVVTSVQSATGGSSGALVQGNLVDLVLTTGAQRPHHAGGARAQHDLRRVQGQHRDEHGRDRLGRRAGLRGLGGGVQPAGERQRHPCGHAPGDQRGLGGHGHRERRARRQQCAARHAVGAGQHHLQRGHRQRGAGRHRRHGGQPHRGRRRERWRARAPRPRRPTTARTTAWAWTTNVDSDLAIVNSQGNLGAGTFAQTTGAAVRAACRPARAARSRCGQQHHGGRRGNTASSAIATGGGRHRSPAPPRWRTSRPTTRRR
jgi:hypothetical protein